MIRLIDVHKSYRTAYNSLHVLKGVNLYYRNKMIGFVFQSAFLIPNKTALDNVALSLLYQKFSKQKRQIIAMQYLERLGLKNWSMHYPNELSGGQRQRVAIARALICNPQVILADEPTGQLDSVTSLEIMDILKEINCTGITIIIVTHEKDIAEATNRIVVINDGMIHNNLK